MLSAILLCTGAGLSSPPAVPMAPPLPPPTARSAALPLAPPPRVQGFSLEAAERTRRAVRVNSGVFTSMRHVRGLPAAEVVTVPQDLVREYRQHQAGVLDVLLREVEGGRHNADARAAAAYALTLLGDEGRGVTCARIWDPNWIGAESAKARQFFAARIREAMGTAPGGPEAPALPAREPQPGRASDRR